MTREKIMVDLFEFSAPTYYKWTKHQKRKIFDLINYAFSDEELLEYLTTNKIQRIEKEKNFLILEASAITFIKTLINVTNYLTTKNCLELLKQTYEKNNSEMILHKFIDELYLKDKSFFVQFFAQNEEISSLKYKIVDIFKKESIAILSYICVNFEETIKSTEYLKNPEFSNYAPRILDVNDIDIDIEIDEFSFPL